MAPHVKWLTDETHHGHLILLWRTNLVFVLFVSAEEANRRRMIGHISFRFVFTSCDALLE